MRWGLASTEPQLWLKEEALQEGPTVHRAAGPAIVSMSSKNPGSPPRAPDVWPKVNGLQRGDWRYIRTSQAGQTPKEKRRDSARPTQTTLTL